MNTHTSTRTKKIKTFEMEYSNIIFIVRVYSHYMAQLNNPYWSSNRYTATIKKTGEDIGVVGSRDAIRKQMQLVNLKYNLFLNN